MDPFFTRQKCIEPESPEDILHIDDRIIYEFPDSYREPSEHHDIDPNSKDIKYDSREKECDRKRDHRDKCCTSVQKKKHDDDRYDDRRFEKSLFYIRESFLDKPCLTENIIMEFYTFWKSFLYFCDFSDERIRELYSIGIGNFRYSDDYSFFPIYEGISSPLTIFSEFYVRYIFEDISIWK